MKLASTARLKESSDSVDPWVALRASLFAGAAGTVVVETEGEGEAPVAAPLCVDNHRHLKATIQVPRLLPAVLLLRYQHVGL